MTVNLKNCGLFVYGVQLSHAVKWGEKVACGGKVI